MFIYVFTYSWAVYFICHIAESEGRLDTAYCTMNIFHINTARFIFPNQVGSPKIGMCLHYDLYTENRVAMMTFCHHCSDSSAINLQIPQCTSPIWYPTMHHFVTEMSHVCTFLLQNGALWDICLMHCGICEMGQFDIMTICSVTCDNKVGIMMTQISVYVHDSAMFCFVMCSYYWFPVDSYDLFTHILQGYFTGTGAQCQRINPEGYE